MLLIGAEQLGIKNKPVARFPLPWSELGVLMLFAPIDEKTLRKLETEKPVLTVGEIGGLLMAVAEAMIDASGIAMQCLEHDRQEFDGLSRSRGHRALITLDSGAGVMVGWQGIG